MKDKYFKFIKIDEPIIHKFLYEHPQFRQYINEYDPFYVRISRKVYPGLIHTIISQDEENENVGIKWNQLCVLAKTIKPKNILKISDRIMIEVLGETKTKLIKKITQDIVEKKLQINKLNKLSSQQIIEQLKPYNDLSLSSIKIFLIFTCFKQDILCLEDQDFDKGLKFFLNKKDINKDDIDNINMEYQGQLTIFSLCMWKIRNERLGK